MPTPVPYMHPERQAEQLRTRLRERQRKDQANYNAFVKAVHENERIEREIHRMQQQLGFNAQTIGRLREQYQRGLQETREVDQQIHMLQRSGVRR
jgi:uncharacterized protein YigA (DUF484 family)